MSSVADVSSRRAAPALGTFERYLTLWVALCIIAGIVLGQLMPAPFQALGRMNVAEVNLPVALLIWLMIVPMLLKVDFGALHRVAEQWRGIAVTVGVNWLIKPFSMALLGWLFDGLEMGLFSLVARPALTDLLQSNDDRQVGLWIGVATAGFLIGAATGLVTAATGVYMIPSAPYLQAIGLEKDDLVQALGLSFTVSTLALAATLVQDGTLQMSIAGASLLALAPALIGMVLGQWVRARVRPETFRICFFAGSLLLGAHLVMRALI